MWTCKHCHLLFEFTKVPEKANHSRWCDQNPKHTEYKEQASTLTKNAVISNIGRKASEEAKDNMRKSKTGKYIGDKNPFYGKTHTDTSRERISIAALNSKHRRLVRSIREYKRKDGSIVMLDSSWEEILAHRLDDLNIAWDRPVDPINWVDSAGKTRHYFPDFYLPDFNIFLDPKNPAAILAQQEKVNWLINNRKDVHFLKTLQECKNYILAFV
jgi:hypothetical protein